MHWFLQENNIETLDGLKVVTKNDYKLREVDVLTGEKKEINLPKSNVLKFILENGAWFVIRPSGTEPKMKAYIATTGKDLKDSEESLERLKNEVVSLINEKLN